MFCIECGRKLFENSKFCRYCGTRQPLEEDDYVPPETVGRPIEKTDAEAEEK